MAYEKRVSKYDHAKKCIDSIVTGWNRTNLSDLEKWAYEEWLVQGALKMAMYFLTFDDYNKLKQYIYDTYGYDPGGCNVNYEEN